MNTPTKASGAAAMLATMVIVTAVWLGKLHGLEIPDVVSQSWQGGLMLLFAWLIHNQVEDKDENLSQRPSGHSDASGSIPGEPSDSGTGVSVGKP